jgi:chorismate mutase/prephenate dehydrogenase
MGRWFAAYFAGQGREVRTVDPRGPVADHASAPSIARGLDGLGPRDVVLVATPMERAGEALAEVRKEGTEALVADICSIKDPVEVELRRMARRGMRVASLHPMWGPDARVLSDKNLLVLDCGSAPGLRAAKALFRRTAVHAHTLPLGRHDELMGWALALPHTATLVFSLALARSGLAAEDVAKLGGPTLRTQLGVARQVASESKELYHGIQALNPHTVRVHRELERALRRVGRARSSGLDFALLMAECERYYAGAAPRRRRP